MWTRATAAISRLKATRDRRFVRWLLLLLCHNARLIFVRPHQVSFVEPNTRRPPSAGAVENHLQVTNMLGYAAADSARPSSVVLSDTCHRSVT
jgi:hypothetical protein